ncbi:MAG: SDR family NAD(P)-dependent oxidoreductase [Candidatus Limnocylindria bacterium]
MSFQGRRAIVTGAGSGIGQATALHLLREGARVTAVDIDDRGLDPVREAGGHALVVDLADPDQRAAVVESARQDPPHALVNAAAILQVIPIGDVDPAVFRRHFTVNVEAVWFLCRDIGAVMVEGGAIVNFSSPSARWAYTLETAVYGATKTAIQGVTRSFAIHLAARHIRVNAISPGITDTPMQEKVLREVSELRGLSYEELSANRTNLVPLRRSAPPEEMAGVVVFLLSDPAAYITGQTIYVDGGYIMSA